jgi:hypothetical protein
VAANHIRINSQQQSFQVLESNQLYLNEMQLNHNTFVQQPKSQKSSTSRLNNSNTRTSKTSIKNTGVVHNTGSTDRLVKKGVNLIS